MNDRQQVDQNGQSLEDFLRKVLQDTLLLSDSSLPLSLQSHLNSEDIQVCVSGQTKYSVEEAIHKFAYLNRRVPEGEEERKRENGIDYDSVAHSLGLDTVVTTAVHRDVKPALLPSSPEEKFRCYCLSHSRLCPVTEKKACS